MNRRRNVVVAGLLSAFLLACALKWSRDRSLRQRFDAAVKALGDKGRTESLVGPPDLDAKAEQDRLDRLGDDLLLPFPGAVASLDPLVRSGPENEYRGLWQAAANGTNRTGAIDWEAFAKATDETRGVQQQIMEIYRNDRPRSWLRLTNWDEAYPSFQRLRNRARAFAAIAQVELHRGDPDRAAMAVHAIFLEGARFRRDGTLVHTMIRSAVVRLAMGNLQGGLGQTGFSDDSLRQLQDDLEQVDWLAELARTFELERAADIGLAYWAFDKSTRERARLVNGGSGNSFDFWKSWFNGEYRAGPKEALATLQLLNEKMELVGVATADPGTLGKLPDQLSARTVPDADLGFFRMIVPSYGRAVSSLILCEANRRMAILRIATERYRLKHGDWPVGPDQLVPDFIEAVPLDPMDGKPLRYRLGPDGNPFIYSVGLDGADDGGQGDAVADELNSPDWPWPRIVPPTGESAVDP